MLPMRLNIPRILGEAEATTGRDIETRPIPASAGTRRIIAQRAGQSQSKDPA